MIHSYNRSQQLLILNSLKPGRYMLFKTRIMTLNCNQCVSVDSLYYELRGLSVFFGRIRAAVAGTSFHTQASYMMKLWQQLPC